MPVSPIFIVAYLAFGILAFATLITALLRLWNPRSETLVKVGVIVRSWWIIMTVFVGALAAGKWGVLALFYLLNLNIVVEYLRHSRIHFKKALGILIVVVTTIQYATIGLGAERLFLSLPGILIPLAVPLLVISSNSIQNLPEVMASSFGLILMSYLVSHIPALAHFHLDLWSTPDQSLLAIALLFFLTEANDVFQFLSGKMFGRRKLVPLISPNKTEAGFVGGLLLTPLLSVLTLHPLLELKIGSALIVGLSLSVMGILGDLMFSSIKRYFQTKDFSDVLPGHGGVLDRLDSLVLTAPIYFHLVLYFKGGIL